MFKHAVFDIKPTYNHSFSHRLVVPNLHKLYHQSNRWNLIIRLQTG